MPRTTVTKLSREVEELRAQLVGLEIRVGEFEEAVSDIGWRLTWLERAAGVPMSQADRVLAEEMHKHRMFQASLWR